MGSLVNSTEHLLVNSTKYLRKKKQKTKNKPVICSLFQKIEAQATLSNSLRLRLANTKTKDITRKENYRPVTLMNIHGKIFNKILTNQNFHVYK